MAGLACCKRIHLSCLKNRSFLGPSHKILAEQRATALTLYEKNKRGTNKDPPHRPLTEVARNVIKDFLPESKKWFQEQREAFTRNPMIQAEHGNYEVIFRFSDKDTVNSWIVTADRDNDGGKSTANFTFSRNKTGLFHGYLCKEVPKDGETKYAGYANITSPKVLKSFKREVSWDWSLFNCMLLRVRGDGRPYMIVIGCDFYYDAYWLNRWSFPLYTRGGPYWQVAKIPFSKFFVSHKGRIQDNQEFVPLNIINSLGITVADSAEGPYFLEIESIALMYDINLRNKHAYETYPDKNLEGQT